jgi:hypothetical protein
MAAFVSLPSFVIHMHALCLVCGLSIFESRVFRPMSCMPEPALEDPTLALDATLHFFNLT